MNTPGALKKVVICDDNAERLAVWQTRIRAILPEDSYLVEALKPADFATAVGALQVRTMSAKEKLDFPAGDAASVFDSADFLILDSDLTPDPDSGVRELSKQEREPITNHLVGEFGNEVARLARGYTMADSVIVVNHIDKRRTFDLTLLKTSAFPGDAYVCEDDLDSKGLWFGENVTGFRPWQWPTLTRLSITRFIDGRSGTLTRDTKVGELLGLAEAEQSRITLRALDALLPDQIELEDATLAHVAASPTLGLSSEPKPTTWPDLELRVAVAALRRWVERFVLSELDVIIDLPHLLHQRPWLSNVRGDEAALDRLLDGTDDSSQIAPDAFHSALSELLGRKVWRVDKLPAIEGREQRISPDDKIFVEDSSRFTNTDSATDFLSDLNGRHKVRYVERLPDVDYSPKRRLY